MNQATQEREVILQLNNVSLGYNKTIYSNGNYAA